VSGYHYVRPYRRRNGTVVRGHLRRKEVRADLLLADEANTEAYVAHFEAQMRRSKLLYASFLQFARGGAMLGLNPIGIWWNPLTLIPDRGCVQSSRDHSHLAPHALGNATIALLIVLRHAFCNIPGNVNLRDNM
jgi:hypothetical protein